MHTLFGSQVNPFTADAVKVYTLPYWSNPLFVIFDIRHNSAQSARMSKIKNGGLDQYGAEPFERQQFRTTGVEGVNCVIFVLYLSLKYI